MRIKRNGGREEGTALPLREILETKSSLPWLAHPCGEKGKPAPWV